MSLFDAPLSDLAAALAGTELRIATGESCTGGQIAGLLAGDPDLGPHLDRGYVLYSPDSKCEEFGVARDDVERDDAVNPAVAIALAKGALSRSGADVAVGVTGFCGPQQGDEEVGRVYIACAKRGAEIIVKQFHFGDIGRQQVLDHAAVEALTMLATAVRT